MQGAGVGGEGGGKEKGESGEKTAGTGKRRGLTKSPKVRGIPRRKLKRGGEQGERGGGVGQPWTAGRKERKKEDTPAEKKKAGERIR